ncbi:hypothetical protein GGR54DRAFT_634607 [Hypoxylon sp. NC1633]|nr:hypothetical protein GGR54DRAFT_634607 [Hypoxylon sp. NC1633]
MESNLPTLSDPVQVASAISVFPAGAQTVKKAGGQGISADGLGAWIKQTGYNASNTNVVLVDCRAKETATKVNEKVLVDHVAVQFIGSIHMPLDERAGVNDVQMMKDAIENHRFNSPTTWSKLIRAKLVIFYCQQGQSRSVGITAKYLQIPKMRQDQLVAFVVGGIGTLKETECTELRGRLQEGEGDLRETGRVEEVDTRKIPGPHLTPNKQPR